MRALFVLAVIADLGLAILLVAVSGFVLQGVNNTATFNSGTAFYIAAMAACFIAPIAAIILWRRSRRELALGVAALPLIGALITLMMPVPY